MRVEYLINRLVEKDFQELKQNYVSINGFLFKKDQRNVVVIKYESGLDVKRINAEILDIRNQLINFMPEINIWNTYVLILIDKTIDIETIHILEKDSTSLRRYVIVTESDINRVFFLDSDKGENSKPIMLTKTKSEENYLLKELYNFIKLNGGEANKLKIDEIKEGIEVLASVIEGGKL